ncbi:MAG: GH3 auxin-responsive promoter family protein [Dysgonamonadaceae bacterium]|jgi:hypothetical protein|nr:GH3 auxin-responsive promoter family protein [Dysgonamonadaceae bacterium]
MNLDKLAIRLFAHRLKKNAQYSQIPDVIQEEQLQSLLSRARHTVYGQMYDFASIRTYSGFSGRLPLQSYEDAKPFIERMMKGEKNVLWRGKVDWFAKSSGTTDDKSKFLPVSRDAMRECHYRGGMDTVANYLNINPDSRLFSGKGLILGGSSAPFSCNENIKIGDLSAVLIENINPIANFFRTPYKKIILMDEWITKLDAIYKHTLHQHITSLSGVPSWMLVLIKKILKQSGKQYLTDVWPDLEVFFHGGVSFTPYREQYKALIPSGRMHYMETYNASEGFFSIQNDWNDPAMLLLLDYGIFYEFIPVEEIDSGNPPICRLQDVELHRNYAVVISTSSGLWRYKIGDTLKFTSKSPYKIIITGRTKHFINVFGEELIVDNAEKALDAACRTTGAKVREYTVAPVYMSSDTKGKHQWLIEFDHAPDDLTLFTRTLDDSLKKHNSDYEAKRYKDMTLELPELILARHNLFYDWLEEKGKLGGQHKVPRLSNTREYMEQLLKENF